jgi:hypothetical protein
MFWALDVLYLDLNITNDIGNRQEVIVSTNSYTPVPICSVYEAYLHKVNF